MTTDVPTDAAPPSDTDRAVLERYAQAADRVEPALCCPTDGYDKTLLEKVPTEIVEKDYGCGDPSRWVRAGDTVVDLGSGAGKACYIMAQKVGLEGRVIGVDFNDAMLALARKYQDEMARKLGSANVEFHKARIQDLALDLDKAQRHLAQQPIDSVEQLSDFEAACDRLRRDDPLIADRSVDVVVSNCVLNLVRPQEKPKLFSEIHRVLKRGGRAVISDIVCDEEPTPQILADPDLWSGCIAGAFREDRFLKMFEQAGFYGIEIVSRQADPWQTIEGIEFRSVTVHAYKGKEGSCLERNQAVVYRGPWKQVRDDDGHTFHRGQRMAVCDKTYRILTDPNGPYAQDIHGIEPYDAISPDEAQPFNCKGAALRHPRQTKGVEYDLTETSGDASCCGPDAECC
ncbi:MAG: methyltransferase domain-containing protein [bacterium]